MPAAIFTIGPDQLKDRLDAFCYAPELVQLWEQLQSAASEGKIELKSGKVVSMIKELASAELQEVGRLKAMCFNKEMVL